MLLEHTCVGSHDTIGLDASNCGFQRGFRMLRVFSFLVAALAWADAAAPIDSPRVVYATYVHNGPGSVVNGIAVDRQGYAYVGGGGPAQGGPRCAFLKKLNQTGTGEVWSVCLPMYQVNALALDAAGYIYVSGDEQQYEYSSRVMKLSPDGQQTIYSTQIPSTRATRLAVDRLGNAYVGGTADANFPATVGAYLTTGAGGFALKLDSSGAIQYATYLDIYGVSGIAIDSKGQAWLVNGACPYTVVLTNCEAGAASAIRKLDATGSHMLVSKTFGGGGSRRMGEAISDGALDVAVDGLDSVWIVGRAESSAVPTTPDALEPQPPPSSRTPRSQVGGIGYAIKLSASGDLLYGTYVGSNPGQFDYQINSVVLDSQGNPYFGLTVSENTATWMSTLMALTSDGSRVLTTFIFDSPAQAIALDGNGGLYIAGNTITLMTTTGAYLGYPGGFSFGIRETSGFAGKFDLTAHGPHLAALVNAANQGHGFGIVAPGELMTLYGSNLPPAPKVTFHGVAAPILYSDSNQINLVVPFAVPRGSIVFSAEGIADYILASSDTSPGLFTADGSGLGQIAALNEDGSVNSIRNPAKAGSAISVFMTGAGPMTPPIGDGELGPLFPPFPTPVNSFSAVVGYDTEVLFVGQAPGLIAGVVQVNLRIPVDAPSGNVRTYLLGGGGTQFGATIAVK
jgi:uncharacterized protein (TIGR03437 family)